MPNPTPEKQAKRGLTEPKAKRGLTEARAKRGLSHFGEQSEPKAKRGLSHFGEQCEPKGTVPFGRRRATLRHLTVGPLHTNCYALASAGECLVIDPGASGASIARELADARVTQVVATHGHHDHVGGVAALQRATGASFAISAADAWRAPQALELSSHHFDVTSAELEDAPEPDRLLREGDEVVVGDMTLRVIEAPGHTEGGIVLLGEGVAFVGDTLFAGSCGRTDLRGGDPDALMATLARLKREIAPETVLLCGHGPATTMERELATNPYLR